MTLQRPRAWHPGRVPSDRKRRLTRRGHYLLAFGLVQVALGLAYLADPSSPAGALAQHLLPPVLYTTASVIVGGLAGVAAFIRPSLERAAFAGLAVVSAARGLSFAAVYALQAIGPEQASEALLTGVLAFVLLVRVHLLVAGWPDPPLIVAPVELTQQQLAALAEYLRNHTGDD